MSFPALDALKEGYEIYTPVDAVGGTSLKAHDAALRRLEQAGAKSISWTQMACELQRDWARSQTAGTFAEILFAVKADNRLSPPPASCTHARIRYRLLPLPRDLSRVAGRP